MTHSTSTNQKVGITVAAILLSALAFMLGAEYGPDLLAEAQATDPLTDPCADIVDYADGFDINPAGLIAIEPPNNRDDQDFERIIRHDQEFVRIMMATPTGRDLYRWASTVDRDPHCFEPEERADAALWLHRVER